MKSGFSDEQLRILCDPESWRLVSCEVGDHALAANSRLERWYEVNRQCHSHCEILVALAGRSFYGLGDHLYSVNPGTVMFFDAMESHQNGYPPFETSVDHLWISVLGGDLSARLLQVRDGKFLGRPIVIAARDAEGQGTSSGSDNWRPKGGAAKLNLMSCAAAAIVMLVDASDTDVEPISLHEERRRMMATIQQHLADTGGCGANLDSLARIAGYSKYHFLRLFKEHTGCTVHQYIDLCRRRSVAEMLSRDVSKKEMAYTLGFSCPQSFSRWYRKHVVHPQ